MTPPWPLYELSTCQNAASLFTFRMRLSHLNQPASVQPPPGASKVQSAIHTVSWSAFEDSGDPENETRSSSVLSAANCCGSGVGAAMAGGEPKPKPSAIEPA